MNAPLNESLEVFLKNLDDTCPGYIANTATVFMLRSHLTAKISDLVPSQSELRIFLEHVMANGHPAWIKNAVRSAVEDVLVD